MLLYAIYCIIHKLIKVLDILGYEIAIRPQERPLTLGELNRGIK